MNDRIEVERRVLTRMANLNPGIGTDEVSWLLGAATAMLVERETLSTMGQLGKDDLTDLRDWLTGPTPEGLYLTVEAGERVVAWLRARIEANG